MFDGFVSLPLLAAGVFFAMSYFVNPSSIVITEMTVPSSLEDKGVTGDVAKHMLTDTIAGIVDTATTNRGAFVTEVSSESISINALEDSLGLAQPIRAAQVAMGLLPYTFSAQFLEEGDDLLLRITGESPAYWTYDVEVRSPEHDVRKLFHDGAVKLLQEIDPYLIAVYHFRLDVATGDLTRTYRAIDHCLVFAKRSELPWVYSLWARALYVQKKYDQSIMRFQQALTLNPSFPRPMMQMGETYAAMGQYDEAIVRYRKTLEIEPVYPEALVLWGKALIAQGRIEEAREKYVAAVEMSPEFPRILHSYGLFLESQGEYAPAAEYLRRAIEHTRIPSDRFIQDLRRVQRALDPELETVAPLATKPADDA